MGFDPFGFLDGAFSFDFGGGAPTDRGQGFAEIQRWALGQYFSSAGPIGQYLGLVYAVRGDPIPNTDWGQRQDARSGGDPRRPVDRRDDGTAGGAVQGDATTAPVADNSGPSLPTTGRTLEHLDREGSVPSAADEEQMPVVNVFGTPRDQHDINDYLDYISRGGWATQDGPWLNSNEIPIVMPSDLPQPTKPPARSPQPRQQAPRKPPVSPIAPTTQPNPDPPGDGGPYFDVQATSPYQAHTSDRVANPWMSDAATPEQFLPWGAWDQPERSSPPRGERSDVGQIETAPTVRPERTFWDRGGTGLVVGAATAAGAVAVLMFWNPVGWAAAGVALGLAGGIAATAASSAELYRSYGGATSAEQDADWNRAVSATLGFSSPGGVIGGVIGTVVSEDPEQGFEEWSMWGGFLEAGAGFAVSLPGALRAVPGISRAALPWAKSLLLTPFWFFMSAGGGGGRVRSLARVFAAQGRATSRIRNVQYLGTTPLLHTTADWARYQTFATRTSNEGVFRITYANGQQRLVLADRFNPGSRTILEAKYGDLGQMWDPTREAHIMGQATNYVDISRMMGGRVGYLVSTESGAMRLTQRFTLEFPSEMESGQLWVDWVKWRK